MNIDINLVIAIAFGVLIGWMFIQVLKFLTRVTVGKSLNSFEEKDYEKGLTKAEFDKRMKQEGTGTGL